MIDSQSLDDLPGIRRFREKIRKWWGLEIGVADTRGYVTDHARGVVVPPHNDFCRASLRDAEGFRRCNRSVEQASVLLRQSGQAGAQVVMPCHLGFPIAMAPVTHAGKSFGSVFTAGFLIAGHDDEARSAVEHGAAFLGLTIADPSIPVLTERDLEYLGDLLETMAAELSVQVAERSDPRRFGDLIGTSPKMQRLYNMLEKVADSDASILVTGENGTGKEVVARAIHSMGPRAERPFVATNASALNDNLLETELFGHVKGAFTGAIRSKDGLFTVANTGTLFLDEVGDTSPAMQVKLLRVLQEGTFMPVGATEPMQVDVRVIAATNRPLQKMVETARFREDLYYRLNVIGLELPPLRERKADLPALCEHFLAERIEKAGGQRQTLSAAVMSCFWEYDWPGNVRQLENEIERLYVLSGSDAEIGPEMLSPVIRKVAASLPIESEPTYGTLEEAVRQTEYRMIRSGLIRTGWNKSKLARELGVSRTTLIKKIREHALEQRPAQVS